MKAKSSEAIIDAPKRKRDLKSQSKQNPSEFKSGRWSREEVKKLVQALKMYGTDYTEIS